MCSLSSARETMMMPVIRRQLLYFVIAIISLIFDSINTLDHPCMEVTGDTFPVRIFQGKCYQFVSNTAAYDVARLTCIQHDGYLVDIADDETRDFLIDTMNNDIGWGWHYAHIGVWKRTGKGPWFGPHGGAIVYSDWNPGKGVCNLLIDVFCFRNNVLLNFRNPGWDNVAAIEVHPYICEYGLKVNQEYKPTNCSSIPSLYNNRDVKEFNGYCYEFVNEIKERFNARDYCYTRGGYLVEIRSSEIQDVLVTTISDLQNRFGWSWNSFWIGASKGSGVWRWGHYDELYFQNWGNVPCSNPPLCRFEYCAILDMATETWTPLFCTNAYAFVCQYKLADDRHRYEEPTLQHIHTPNETESKQTEIGAKETIDGIVFTIIAAILALFSSTFFMLQIFTRIDQFRRTRIALCEGTATKDFWDNMLAEVHAHSIPDFEDEISRQAYCLNIPPPDLRFEIVYKQQSLSLFC